MAQQTTIDLDALRAALFSARMRRRNAGRTCLLAAVTDAPLIQSDCSDPRRVRSQAEVMRYGMSRCTLTPMQRGHIAGLVERTRFMHGLKEVRATWGVGIKALRAEPKYILNGGAA